MIESSKPEMLDLMETGTRYEHYQELKEIFMRGIEEIARLTWKAPDDLATSDEMKIAVKLIQKRLDFLSNREKKTAYSSELAQTLREIEHDRKVTKLLCEINPPVPRVGGIDNAAGLAN